VTQLIKKKNFRGQKRCQLRILSCKTCPFVPRYSACRLRFTYKLLQVKHFLATAILQSPWRKTWGNAWYCAWLKLTSFFAVKKITCILSWIKPVRFTCRVISEHQIWCKVNVWIYVLSQCNGKKNAEIIRYHYVHDSQGHVLIVFPK